MKRRKQLMKSTVVVSVLAASFFGLVVGVSRADPQGARIAGDYIEARTCDVWTGPCFSNSEINLRGKQAVLGWSVRDGSWDGVRLDGLTVVLSLLSEGTLQTRTEGAVKAAVYVDEKAGAKEEKALLAMAKKLAPRYLEHVVTVERRKIDYRRSAAGAELAVARKDGRDEEIKVETAPLSWHCDAVCGNEEKAYPSLSKFARTECAKTVTHFYRDGALGVVWSDPGTRGVQLGKFEL